MARREQVTKPVWRFFVKDDTINTWGVYDRHLEKWVTREITSPGEARAIAEEYNRNPPPLEKYEDSTY